MTHKDLYEILNNSIQKDSEDRINLIGAWEFKNQLSLFSDAKINNDEAINIKTIKEIFNQLNEANELFKWEVQNANVE